MPKWGDSQRYTIGYANQMWGSDIDALMLEAQYTLIRTFARKHRFVLRSHLGWIETGDFNDVPPDLRYFAGGDRSIRGYDYESISPKDENGDLTGASKMITGSIEYQLRVKGKWWGAVFFDIGRADTNFEFSNLKKAQASACAGNRLSVRSSLTLQNRWATPRKTVSSSTSVWGLNYDVGQKTFHRCNLCAGRACSRPRISARH